MKNKKYIFSDLSKNVSKKVDKKMVNKSGHKVGQKIDIIVKLKISSGKKNRPHWPRAPPPSYGGALGTGALVVKEAHACTRV